MTEIRTCTTSAGANDGMASVLTIPTVHACSFKIFQARKAGVTSQWNQRLPDFVKRLEEALYRAARSKVCPHNFHTQFGSLNMMTPVRCRGALSYAFRPHQKHLNSDT